MREISTIVSGNLATSPRRMQSGNGQSVQFRLAVNPTYYDRASGTYKNGKTEYFGVFAGGKLARNAYECLHVGDPVFVQGRLSTSEWKREDGSVATDLTLNASVIGHDLTFGHAFFTRMATDRDLRSWDDPAPEGVDPETGEIAPATGESHAETDESIAPDPALPREDDLSLAEADAEEEYVGAPV